VSTSRGNGEWTYLAARGAGVARVLGDFHLLDAGRSVAPGGREKLTSYGAKHRNGYRTFR
jgi:hypothetical protein